MLSTHARLFAALAALTSASPVFAQGAPDWPYPNDIPKPAPAAAGLAGAEPPSIVRFLKISGAGKTLMSPDGASIAYIDRTTGEPQLWSVSSKGGAPRQLTFGTGVSDFEWTPGGELLIAADSDGNEREGYTILAPDGLFERRVLAQSDAFNAFGDFSAAGDRFVYSTTGRNGVDYDVYVGSTDGGEPKEILQGRFGYFASAWRPGGEEVLVSETRGEDANDLHLLDLATGELETLFAPEVASSYFSFAWEPDGAGFYLATNHERGFEGLARFDMEARELTFIETPEHDISNVRLADDGRYLAWTTNEGGFSRLHVRDLRNGRDLAAPELPDGVYSVSAAANAPMLAVRVSGPDTPGDVYRVALGRRPRAALVTSASDAGLDRAGFVAPESLFFEARDGVRLNGLLYLPTERALGETPPVVLMVHGGPTAQARPSFDAIAQYLAARGIAAFDLNFRGSTGFGKEFARLNDKRLRSNEIYDVADAIAFLAGDERVDASRAAVMGGSYGGYLTNAAVGKFPELFRAGVSFVGVSDWVRALEEAGPSLKASDREEYGDISDPDDRAYFESISPLRDVDRVKAAMFFSHGANDPRDPVEETDRFVKALRENGVEVVYMRFPDEGHGVRKLKNRVHVYQGVAAFLEEQLAP